MAGTYTVTSSTAGTYTITVGATTSETALPPARKKQLDLSEFFKEGYPEPEAMAPRVFGTCGRCSTNMALDAYGGRCSVCGGVLTVR